MNGLTEVTNRNHNDGDNTPFSKALRWRVHDPEEALGIAATHHRRAAEARARKPVTVDSFQDQSAAAWQDRRAAAHDAMAEACERHAATLRGRQAMP
jgi:hypothetical protein